MLLMVVNNDTLFFPQLHIAAANGYVRVVEYLLGQNVPTEARDHDDWSPLHAAACWGHVGFWKWHRSFVGPD